MTPTVTPSIDKTGGYELKYQYKNGIDPRLKLLLVAASVFLSTVGGSFSAFAKAVKEYAES